LKAEGKVESQLACYDARFVDRRSGTIGATELSGLLSKIKAERMVIILDCCFAEGMVVFKDGLKKTWFADLSAEDYKRLIGEGKGKVLLASSGAYEQSRVEKRGRNSIFTRFLLDALRGGAARTLHRAIIIDDIFDYVRTKMERRKEEQVPTLISVKKKSFPVALVRWEVRLWRIIQIMICMLLVICVVRVLFSLVYSPQWFVPVEQTPTPASTPTPIPKTPTPTLTPRRLPTKNPSQKPTPPSDVKPLDLTRKINEAKSYCAVKGEGNLEQCIDKYQEIVASLPPILYDLLDHNELERAKTSTSDKAIEIYEQQLLLLIKAAKQGGNSHE
jgi:hypothetical protein